jgi:nucleotide-binding universal stress UspA family protein
VLFGSGRPVLVLPHALEAAPNFQTVVVGWDHSRAAARAMGDAMPFLAAAGTVHVVTVDTASNAVRETGDDIIRHLARRSVKAQYVERAGEDQPVGNVLQAYCNEISAGLLVMGAHGHSRLREFILGGATLDVLNETRLPVFLAV